MSLRSRLSWVVRGAARADELERRVDELESRIAALTTGQVETLDVVRSSASAVLDDIEQRMTELDRRTR
jgi:uncharacterized protein YceH (UPF0502 family)